MSGDDTRATIDLETIEPGPVPDAAQQEFVSTRDGVQLATDVYLPSGSGPWPVVLVRLPYDKDGRYTFMPQLAPHVTDRGYAFVVQDVRGKFRSDGETVPFVHEVEDGYDTLEWIAAQPWAGEIGMFGDSYYGFTQWAAVASGHPALRAIVPRVTSADLGTWLHDGVEPLYGAQYLAECWTGRLMHTWPIDWSRRPLAEMFDDGFAAIGERSAGFDLALRRRAGGVPFDPYGGQRPFDRLSIPVLHCVGWFDNISPQHMVDYMRLVADPRVAHLQYLVGDATDHENYRLGDVPIPDGLDHDVNDEALERMIPGYLGPALDFFDAVLAGRSDPADLPRVRWRLGAGEWRESPAWPPPGSHEVRLLLADADAATRDQHGGSLTGTAAEPTAARWTHDPANLVPSTLANPFAFLHEYPDEREVEGRPDVLTFTGPALAEPLELAGPVSARLRVSSTGPSTHLHVKLVDVFPDGRALMLLRGQTAVSTPGPDPATAEIDLGHTGYTVAGGHRLRIHIASSDYPLYVPHPGTEDDPWTAGAPQATRQALHCGGADPSHITVTAITTQAE